MTRSRYKILDNQYPYYLTCTIVDWLPLFSNPYIVQIILDSPGFLQKENRLLIYAYVIMENHLHLNASSDDLSKEIGDFKSYTETVRTRNRVPGITCALVRSELC